MSQALTDTYGNYHNEMERTFASIRKRASQLQEDIPNMVRDIQPQSEEIVRAVKATGKVTGPQRVVVEVFAWSSVMVMATGIGSMFGAYLLGPFVSLFFGKFFAALLAFFIIPVFSHAIIRNRERHFESDNKIRTSMLVTSLMQGVLAGYAINSYYLSAQPLGSITPAVVSIGYTISVRQSHGNRFQVLGFSLGTAFLVNLIMGAILEATLIRTLLPLCISYSKERLSTASELTSNEA
ncbi:hypothetical protein Aduo_004514 [Ancylostoma duodenale]